MSYAPKLAAALSGATIRQLAYGASRGLMDSRSWLPEYSAIRPIDYSFRDVIALRTCMRLRQGGVATENPARTRYSSRRSRSARSPVLVSAGHRRVDGLLRRLRPCCGLLRQKGNVVIHQFVEVLQPFYVQGRQIPALLEPREHVRSILVFAVANRSSPGPGFRTTRLRRCSGTGWRPKTWRVLPASVA